MEGMHMSQEAPSLEALTEQLQRFISTLNEHTYALDRAHKAAKRLAPAGALIATGTLEKELSHLRKCPQNWDIAELHDALVQGLEAQLEHLRHFGRHQLLGAIRSRAIDEQLAEPTLLAEQPLTLLINPLTCELDMKRGEARLLFARELVARTTLDAHAIFTSRAETMKRIQDQAMPAPEFFDALHASYRMVLLARGSTHGERVDLVDLLAPLALLRNPVDTWRKLDLAKHGSFPKYLFAYQLRRLRKERLLEKGGLRLELGTATGGNTKNKKNVLFLPTRGDEGQYYLSLCFRRL